jgi:hypothetical protein
MNIDPYDPVSFAFYKDCTLPAPINPDEWSGVGIFFFASFMLIACSCVGGCVFKALKYNVRGFDVVPFIDEMRTARAKFCPASDSTYQVFQSNVGPQAQFDTHLSQSSGNSTSQYGSSYQNL